MATRTTETTLTFCRPFALSAVDRPSPAGTYRLAVDEEDLPGLSFLAFKRASRRRCTSRALSAPGGPNQMFVVNPDELAAAFEADRRSA
jgi:hypothetical protein